MTQSVNDNGPVAHDLPNNVPDKIFTKIASECIFTPVLCSPTLDQSVVLSTLISNANEQTRTILSDLKINESFSSNLKRINSSTVKDITNALKYCYGIEDKNPLPQNYKNLKSKV